MQNSHPPMSVVEAPITGFSALELAAAHVADFEVTEAEQIQEIEQALMLAAEHLHERGHGLDWQGFEPAAFFRQVAFMDEREQVTMAQILMGFFVWLACRRLVPAVASLEILEALAALFPGIGGLEYLLLQARPLLHHLQECTCLN